MPLISSSSKRTARLTYRELALTLHSQMCFCLRRVVSVSAVCRHAAVSSQQQAAGGWVVVVGCCAEPPQGQSACAAVWPAQSEGCWSGAVDFNHCALALHALECIVAFCCCRCRDIHLQAMLQTSLAASHTTSEPTRPISHNAPNSSSSSHSSGGSERSHDVSRLAAAHGVPAHA